jgi:hypothetical protein
MKKWNNMRRAIQKGAMPFESPPLTTLLPPPPSLIRQPSARTVRCGRGNGDGKHLVLKYGSEFLGTASFVVHACKTNDHHVCPGTCFQPVAVGVDVSFDPRPLTFEEWVVSEK